MARWLFGAVMLTGTIVSVAACAHLPVTINPNPTGSPQPTFSSSSTPSPSPTGSSTACNGQASNVTVIVAMSLAIAPTSAPNYGTINGYTTVDPATGTFGNVATVITAKTSDIVQFANADIGTTPIQHSAVSFPNATSFPATPYNFPSSTQQSLGTQITQSQWSTGIVPGPNTSGACFSQTFTLPSPGTYYFGDYNYYNLSNMRDVIVVTH